MATPSSKNNRLCLPLNSFFISFTQCFYGDVALWHCGVFGFTVLKPHYQNTDAPQRKNACFLHKLTKQIHKSSKYFPSSNKTLIILFLKYFCMQQSVLFLMQRTKSSHRFSNQIINLCGLCALCVKNNCNSLHGLLLIINL